MARQEIETPNYVGMWTCKKGDPRSSVFIAFLGWTTSYEGGGTEGGRMFDFRGVSDFNITKRGGEAEVSIKYIPCLSDGFSGKIDCTAREVDGFVRGTWADGEFSATKFENAFLCNNPSMRLLFEREYSLLVTKMIESERGMPFSIFLKNVSKGTR